MELETWLEHATCALRMSCSTNWVYHKIIFSLTLPCPQVLVIARSCGFKSRHPHHNRTPILIQCVSWLVSVFFIRKSLFNGICQHNLTKAGNKARKGDWHQGSSRWAAHPQRDAGDVGAKGADRGNRHRCRLTYTWRVTYYRTAASDSKQADQRVWKEKPWAWRA